MKTIDEFAREYADKSVQQCINVTMDELKDYAIVDFKAGVEIVQRWVSIEDELPQYYQSVLADNGEYMSVVARVSDGDEDDYSICGTNIYMSPDPIKWRHIELK